MCYGLAHHRLQSFRSAAKHECLVVPGSALPKRAGIFSVERLMEFLTHLGQDVEITVRPTRKEHGKVSVVGAA